MVVALIVLSALISRLLQNIGRIIDNMEAFRKEGLIKKSKVKTGDELEILAESFYQLSKDLVKEKSDVENRIDKRTEELQQINSAMIGRELKMIELKEKINKLENKNEK